VHIGSLRLLLDALFLSNRIKLTLHCNNLQHKSQNHVMNNSKKWISSKGRKGSKATPSANISIVSDKSNRAPPSPPTRIPSAGSGSADMTFEFGSVPSRGSINFSHGTAAMGSSSSIDTLSIGTGLTPSPSTTPPKKSWEKNYKSFLKKSKIVTPFSIGQDDPINLQPPLSTFRHQSRPRTATDDATKQLQPMLASGKYGDDLGLSLADGFQSNCSITCPPSPSSSKDSSLKGGKIFKRLRSKTKSNDCLDSTLRRGVDRKSPSSTPPGSNESTPRRTSDFVTQQRGEVKASALHAHLSTPHLDPSISRRGYRNSDLPLSMIQSHGNLDKNDCLDKARHRGHSISLDKSMKMFSRVQSMGCNLAIREGEPALTQTEEEELIRERKKAFTDFHNMGIDSTSAFLGGEDSSVHERNVFLASMAYPAGSAGGKGEFYSQRLDDYLYCDSTDIYFTSIAPIRYTPGIEGPHSMDRNKISPSVSANNLVSGPGPSLAESGEIGITPIRSLRSIQGPEKWTKGERYAILPAVLSMLPIGVLTDVMSNDEKSLTKNKDSFGGSKQRAFGIGSIISEDDHDHHESGWFFGEHHNVVTGLPRASNIPSSSPFEKVILGNATVATLGIRSFVAEIHGWCTGTFVLRQNYLFEYRETDSLNGLPWGYAMLQFAEAYPHKHFSNALHLEYFERPCSKSGKRSVSCCALCLIVK
jgi:hypothetical protein